MAGVEAFSDRIRPGRAGDAAAERVRREGPAIRRMARVRMVDALGRDEPDHA